MSTRTLGAAIRYLEANRAECTPTTLGIGLRQLGYTDDLVAEALAAVFGHRLRPARAVGETERLPPSDQRLFCRL